MAPPPARLPRRRVLTLTGGRVALAWVRDAAGRVTESLRIPGMGRRAAFTPAHPD